MEKLAQQIKSWNKNNIHDLKRQLDELKNELNYDEELSDYLDVTSLPSYPIPESRYDLAGYPIWAIDEAGFCLVGETLESVEHIAEILEHLEES
jgi:hypothetical protein